MGGIVTSGIIMGVIATALMDCWAITLKRISGIPLPNWGMVGRWVAHLGRGRVFHDSIADANPVANENRIGWLFHYGVGIVYGVIFATIMGSNWIGAPTFLPAWIFALLTVGFGWFLLQPGLGLGWAAAKTPTPWKIRGLNLVAHTVFGVGLWVGALLWGRALL